MAEKIVYDLKFRDDDGEERTKQITIDFFSNGMRRDYWDLFGEMMAVKSEWDAMSDLNSQIGELMTLKPEGWKDSISEKRAQIKKLEMKIIDSNCDGHTEKRFELLQKMLRKNRVTDPQLLDREFWDENVDPSAIIELLALAEGKDYDKKKVN